LKVLDKKAKSHTNMSMPEQERRIDPSDGKAYTLPEVLEMYRQQYEVSQIRLYWFHEMKPDEQERRIDPSDGKAYTLSEVLGMYRQQYEVSQIRLYWFHEMKPELRFDVGDRVLCNVGERRLVGVVKMKDVWTHGDHGEGHGDHGENHCQRIAYLVQPDAIPGSESKPMITVWYDDDEVVCRERCFHESESSLTKWAAPIISENQRKPLRFSPDEIVVIRIWDTDGGYEQWVCGRVLEIWPSLPEPVLEGFLQSADAVPYKVDVYGHGIFYCHRDDRTLLRRPENVPRAPGQRLTARFELRERMFDNLTLHDTIMQPDCDVDRAAADNDDNYEIVRASELGDQIVVSSSHEILSASELGR